MISQKDLVSQCLTCSRQLRVPASAMDSAMNLFDGRVVTSSETFCLCATMVCREEMSACTKPFDAEE